MSRRPNDFGPQDLTVAEILVLQQANNPQGVHGYGLAELFGKDAARNGTIYRTLGRLAQRGYLSTEIEGEDTLNTHTGPARRVYRATNDGNTIVLQALAALGMDRKIKDNKDIAAYAIGERVTALPEPRRDLTIQWIELQEQKAAQE